MNTMKTVGELITELRPYENDSSVKVSCCNCGMELLITKHGVEIDKISLE